MTFKNILQYAIGPLGAAAIGFIVLPLMTWLYTVDDVANYALFQVVVSVSLLACSLGLDQGYVREYYECKSKSALFLLVTLSSVLVFILIAIASLYYSDRVTYTLFDTESKSILYILLITIFLNILVRYFSLILRMEGKALSYSLAQVFPKLFFLLILLLFGWFGFSKGFKDLLIANLMSVFLVFVLVSTSVSKFWVFNLKERLTEPDVLRLARYSLPLLFSSLAFWGLTGADRVYLKLMSNAYELANYSVAVSFATVGVLLQSVFSTVWAPQVYKWISEGGNEQKIEEVTTLITFLVLLLWCLTGIFSWTLTSLIPSDYNQVVFLIVPSIAYPLLYTLSECTSIGLNVKRKTNHIFIISMICLLLNCALNFLLIPEYGAKGAVLSSVISFWCYFSLKTYFSFKYYLEFKYFSKWLLVTFFTLVSLATLNLSSFFVSIIYSILFLFIFFYFSDCIHKYKAKVLSYVTK